MADVDYQTITVYSGNYADFVDAKYENNQRAAAQAKAAQKKVAELQEFVQRFGSHASKSKQAQSRVKQIDKLIAERRMDMFLDLHNPAPGDPTFFYILDNSLHPAATIALRDRFIELAYGRISKIKPLIPMSNKPKPTGPNYHPLWKQISANWVCMNGNPQTVAVCLETIWNYKNCTTEGYRAVGSNLAAAVQEFLKERLDRDNTRLPPPVAADGK